MVPIHDSWTLSTWQRAVSEPERISRPLLASLRGKLADAPDDAEVTLTVGTVRALLAAHERPEVERGVRIDDDRRRCTYRVALGRGDGRRWLQHVEVTPWDDRPDPAAFRLPPRDLASAAARVLAEQEGTDPSDPAGVLIFGDRVPGKAPDPEELADLVRGGMPREEIARAYGRSLSRVHQWIRQARRDRPELFPARTRGPAPRPTDHEEQDR